MLQENLAEQQSKPTVEEIAIDGFDHIEFCVGNAKQAAYYYRRAFGFDFVGYRGLETGERREVSYALKQDHVYLVLTGSLQSDSLVSHHVQRHGDGVRTIALKVRDAKKAYETALARGAEKASELEVYEGADGAFRSGSVRTYGDTIHKFVERGEFKGTFAPGFRAIDGGQPTETVGLAAIDHVVGSVERAHLDDWIDFYKNVFGFYVYQYFGDEDISTQFSSLVSPVMANKSGSIKLPFIAPAPGLRKSQVEEYLDYYRAPGVQHIAIATRDIIATTAQLQNRGVEFLKVPRSYYEALPERVGKIDEDLEKLAQLGILVDRESEGYLLQIFTKPVQDRPTLFFEVIQRKGAKGFGKGNFQALFESIEREQAQRGNL
jgi:4-hydroxyphenylpyruvate dioxygenase